jgi:hypothetical protein
VEALEAGKSGNVDTDTITVIEGTLGLSAKVSNPEPTIGGVDANVIGASEDDRTALRQTVLDGLRSNVEKQIRAQISANDLLLIDTLEIKDLQREEFSPPDGEEGSTLTFSVQAEFTAQYILAEDLKALAASSVTASIPQDFSPSGEMIFNLLDTPVTDTTGVTSFRLQASQTSLRNVDKLQVLNLIRGRSAQVAAAAVKNALALPNEPQIVITPSWWKWLPLIPFNISVEVK